jgi:hypothetical protein
MSHRTTASTATVETTGVRPWQQSSEFPAACVATALLRAAAQLMPDGTQLQIKTIRA